MIVSFDDCYEELIRRGGPRTRYTYEQWTKRQGYQDVVKFVHDFQHQRIFELKPEDIKSTLSETEHALGNVPKEHQIREIENFTCPFALQHIFHRFIERSGDIPTWQRFWRWMTRQAKPYWIDQLEPLKSKLRTQYKEERIDNAIRWRLGKFYYSALREVDLLVSLHSKGLPIRYHVLADVLLRVDYWINSTLICIYFPNAAYRADQKGRKAPAERFFDTAVPPFDIIDFKVEREGFGRTWLINEASKEELAAQLRDKC